MRIAEELEQWGVSNYDSCFAKNANSNLTNFTQSRKLSLMRFLSVQLVICSQVVMKMMGGEINNSFDAMTVQK